VSGAQQPERSVSAERVISAPAHEIFEVLTDPAQHPLIDGSSSVVRPLAGNPRQLEMGSRFGMRMQLIGPYVIHCRVVEFDADRRIAWRHFGKHRWRYELEPLEPLEPDGSAGEGAARTRVIETFDWSTSIFPKVIEMLGFPARNLAGIARTLDRLDRHVRGESTAT
jgi:hypothetical protein